jgi:carbonic anhydrase
MLHSYSVSIARAVEEGRCAIIGLEYDLQDGQAHLVAQIGQIA